MLDKKEISLVQHTCTESALMTSPLSLSASSRPTAVLPTAVGPVTMMTWRRAQRDGCMIIARRTMMAMPMHLRQRLACSLR